MHGIAAERFQENFDKLERTIIVDTFCKAGTQKGIIVKEFEDRCIEATNSCDSAVPLLIERQFRNMYSIYVEETGTWYRARSELHVKVQPCDLWRLLMARLYHNIHAQRTWPWYSKDCVSATVHDVKASLRLKKETLLELVRMRPDEEIERHRSERGRNPKLFATSRT